MASDEDGEKAAFLWRIIAVARYAVVSVVTVIAVAVFVKTLSAVLKPKDIRLVVVGGSVLVDRFLVNPPKEVVFRFTLSAYNPTSRHVDVTYSNIVGRFIDESEKVPYYAFIKFLVPDIVLPTQTTIGMNSMVKANPFSVGLHSDVFSTLYDENSITMALKLNGTLVTSQPSRGNITTIFCAYYCWPMTVGYNPGSSEDVSCVRV